MRTVEFYYLIPIAIPTPVDAEIEGYPFESKYNMTTESINEILSYKNIIYNLGIFGICNIKINELKGKNHTSFLNKYLSFCSVIPFRLIKISGSISFNDNLLANDLNRITNNNDDKNCKFQLSILHGYIERAFHYFYLACIISKPGVFYFGDCVLSIKDFIKNKVMRYYSAGLREASKAAITNKWPPLTTLPIIDTFIWICTHCYSEDMKYIKIQNLINTFGYVVDSLKSPLHTLISMVGLESFYESNGSKRDLRNRIHVFLGKTENSGKTIDKLYNIRSKIIHGGIQINPPYIDWVDYFDDSKEGNEITRLENHSQAIMLSTIQKLVKHGAYSLVYSEQCTIMK